MHLKDMIDKVREEAMAERLKKLQEEQAQRDEERRLRDERLKQSAQGHVDEIMKEILETLKVSPDRKSALIRSEGRDGCMNKFVRELLIEGGLAPTRVTSKLTANGELAYEEWKIDF